MRLRPGQILLFFLKFMVLFCLLVFPKWSLLGRTYSTAYCVFGNWFLDDFGKDGSVHYETVRALRARLERLKQIQADLARRLGRGPNYTELAREAGITPGDVQLMVEMSQKLDARKTDDNWDVVMYLRNKATGATMNNIGSSRFKGFEPTAFVISLILATPVSWRRRGWALLWGIPLVSLYVGLRLYIFLIHIFTRRPEDLASTGELHLAVYQLPEWMRDFIGYLAYVFDTSFAGCFVLAGCIWFLVVFRRSDLVPGELPPANGAERSTATDEATSDH